MADRLAVHKQIQRATLVVIAAMISVVFAIPFEAQAETPLAAFCADNADRLQRTFHESGLDPALWASDPKNLARFGFQGPGDIDTLYRTVPPTLLPQQTVPGVPMVPPPGEGT